MENTSNQIKKESSKSIHPVKSYKITNIKKYSRTDNLLFYKSQLKVTTTIHILGFSMVYFFILS